MTFDWQRQRPNFQRIWSAKIATVNSWDQQSVWNCSSETILQKKVSGSSSSFTVLTNQPKNRPTGEVIRMCWSSIKIAWIPTYSRHTFACQKMARYSTTQVSHVCYSFHIETNHLGWSQHVSQENNTLLLSMKSVGYKKGSVLHGMHEIIPT